MNRLLVAALLCIVLLVPAVAQAGRVAVIVDGGRRARAPKAQLVRALLNAGLDVMSDSEYIAEAQRAGVTRKRLITPVGVRRAAASAAVDGVLHARVRGKRLIVRYFDADGQRRLNRAYPLRRGRLRPADLRRVGKFVEGKAGQTRMPPPEPTPPPEPDYAATTQPEPDPAFTAPEPPVVTNPPPQEEWAKAEEPASDWARRDEPAADWGEPVGSAAPVTSAARFPMLSIRFVAGGGNRTYRLTGAQTMVQYDTAGMYPEAGVVIESFPLRDAGGMAEGFGLELAFQRGFLASTFVDATDQSNQLQTPVQRWWADARYLLRLSRDSAFMPSLGLRVGFSTTDFSAEMANAVFTGVHHSGLRVGGELSQPIFPPLVALNVAAVVLPMAQTGVAEAAAYGPQSSAFGWMLRAGLTGGTAAFERGVTWGAWVEMWNFSDRFTGDGTRDSDAVATESYLSLGGGLGYAF